MTETELLAGAAARPITPALDRGSVYLAGFQPNRPASGVEAPLMVRALSLRFRNQVAVLVSCDLIGLSSPDVLDIRTRLAALGVDGNGLIVTCTHTHSAPDTLGLWGPAPDTSGVDPAFLATVRETIFQVAAEALTFSCPAQMRSATTRLPDLIANLRTPGLIDDELAALQFVKPDGEVIATVVNLDCHPEVLTGTSTLLSPDYAGAACRAIESAQGGVALHLSGALGGMLSPALDERTVEGVERMGRAYAEAALAALRDAPLGDVGRLVLRRAPLDLALENPLFERALAAGVLRARPIHNGRLASECSYLDIGPVQLAGIPGELLPALGRELKAAMPGPVRMIAGLADDELGYILPEADFVQPADYHNPGSQYEESMSLGPHTGPAVMQAMRGLIEGSTPYEQA